MRSGVPRRSLSLLTTASQREERKHGKSLKIFHLKSFLSQRRVAAARRLGQHGAVPSSSLDRPGESSEWTDRRRGRRQALETSLFYFILFFCTHSKLSHAAARRIPVYMMQFARDDRARVSSSWQRLTAGSRQQAAGTHCTPPLQHPPPPVRPHGAPPAPPTIRRCPAQEDTVLAAKREAREWLRTSAKAWGLAFWTAAGRAREEEANGACPALSLPFALPTQCHPHSPPLSLSLLSSSRCSALRHHPSTRCVPARSIATRCDRGVAWCVSLRACEFRRPPVTHSPFL